MSITFALPNYSFGTSAGTAVVQDPHGLNRGTTFSGPSPFEIPEYVNLTLEPPSLLSIEFRYPNQEPPEGIFRKASADGSTAVSLAAKTKKILQIVYRGDIDSLLAAKLQLDDSQLTASIGETSSQALNSFHQNLMLVKTILAKMPEELAAELREAIRVASKKP